MAERRLRPKPKPGDFEYLTDEQLDAAAEVTPERERLARAQATKEGARLLDAAPKEDDA